MAKVNSNHIKANKMCVACSMLGRNEICIQNLSREGCTDERTQ
jgi:hypothetical protein